jgi:hypothetical protein
MGLSKNLAQVPTKKWEKGKNFPDVVCESKGTVGKDIEHLIKTTGVGTANRLMLPSPSCRQMAAKKKFLQLEKDGIVQRSASTWSSPLHMKLEN